MRAVDVSRATGIERRAILPTRGEASRRDGAVCGWYPLRRDSAHHVQQAIARPGDLLPAPAEPAHVVEQLAGMLPACVVDGTQAHLAAVVEIAGDVCRRSRRR